MVPVLKLPIDIENFKEMRTEGFYYVDKTEMISVLLNDWGKVNRTKLQHNHLVHGYKFLTEPPVCKIRTDGAIVNLSDAVPS